MSCVQDWATAQDPATWCTGPCENFQRFTDCHGYDIVVAGPLISDWGVEYYYEREHGQLVGVVFDGNGGPSCIGGAVTPVPIADCFDGGWPPSLCPSPVDANGC